MKQSRGPHYEIILKRALGQWVKYPTGFYLPNRQHGEFTSMPHQTITRVYMNCFPTLDDFC